MKDPALYKALRNPLAILFHFLYRPTIIGKQHIPQKGRVVLAGNHTHYFDCALIGCGTKRCVQYLAKDELLQGPLKYIFKPMGIIPVNRRTKDKTALHTAIKTLEADKVIGIFPEGTINRTDNVIMPFKYGAVKMAYEADAEIVPFIITGKYKLFKKGIRIQFMEPLKPTEDFKETNRKLMDIVSEGLIREGAKSAQHK